MGTAKVGAVAATQPSSSENVSLYGQYTLSVSLSLCVDFFCLSFCLRLSVCLSLSLSLSLINYISSQVELKKRNVYCSCLYLYPPSLLSTVASELEQLFVKQSSLEVFFEWLDSIIEKRVSEVSLLSKENETILSWQKSGY